MKTPVRACRLQLDIQADTRDEMVRALEGIATAIDRREMSTGCSGGVHSGWTYEYAENDGPSHEEYQLQLKAYVAATRAEKETRSDPEAPEKIWDCSICGRSNYVTVTHCEQCEYSRMVTREGRLVPRDGQR